MSELVINNNIVNDLSIKHSFYYLSDELFA